MIEISFILAFSVLFLHVCTWEGMIFEFVSNKLYNLSDKIKKPLYEWILELFAAGGINTVLIYLISSNRELTKELKDENESAGR